MKFWKKKKEIIMVDTDHVKGVTITKTMNEKEELEHLRKFKEDTEIKAYKEKLRKEYSVILQKVETRQIPAKLKTYKLILYTEAGKFTGYVSDIIIKGHNYSMFRQYNISYPNYTYLTKSPLELLDTYSLRIHNDRSYHYSNMQSYPLSKEEQARLNLYIELRNKNTTTLNSDFIYEFKDSTLSDIYKLGTLIIKTFKTNTEIMIDTSKITAVTCNLYKEEDVELSEEYLVDILSK